MKQKLLVLGILVALLVPATLFAGGEAEAETQKISKINGVFDIILTKESGQDEWAGKFEEITGVEIEIVKPPHNQYSQILGTIFASGDLPDICEIQTGD
ncbi:hypothetical protein ES703_108681 [subsurface metagenome]